MWGHPETTSGIVSLKKSCLVSSGKAGTVVGSPNRLEGEGFCAQLWIQRASIGTMTPGDGHRLSPSVHACFIGMKQARGRWASRAEANSRDKEEEVTRRKGHSAQSSFCMLLAQGGRMSSHRLDTCQNCHRGQVGWSGGPEAPEQRPMAASWWSCLQLSKCEPSVSHILVPGSVF